jgi:2-polyprenyl-6-methoxyphenol hydroxylase-like FAD-dependent oxidoreductase
VVVGAGPSGLTVAAEIARTGASVLVHEKRAVEPIPRAGTLLPRPLELFDARGIAGRFVRRTCELNPHPFQTWHIWAGMHPVDWTGRDSRFGFTLFLPQHETEAILRDWATESGAELRFRSEVVDLADEGDRLRVRSLDAESRSHTTTARYVIGADGGHSSTRQLAGIDFVGHDETFTGVIATAEMDFPWPGGLKVGHNERGWLSSFPFGPALTRFVLVHAEMRTMPQDAPVTVEELNRCVGEILDEHRWRFRAFWLPLGMETPSGWRVSSARVRCSWSGNRLASTTRRAASE